MSKLILYAYPPYVLLSFVQACATREQLTNLGINPLCSGLLLALGILFLPIWVLTFAVHVNESSADDDLDDEYSIDIHIGRGKKRRDTD